MDWCERRKGQLYLFSFGLENWMTGAELGAPEMFVQEYYTSSPDIVSLPCLQIVSKQLYINKSNNSSNDNK